MNGGCGAAGVDVYYPRLTIASLSTHYWLTIGGYLSRFWSLEAGDCVSLVLLIGLGLGCRLVLDRFRVWRCWSVCLSLLAHYMDSLLARYWWLFESILVTRGR